MKQSDERVRETEPISGGWGEGQRSSAWRSELGKVIPRDLLTY